MNIDTSVIEAGARSTESGPEIHTRQDLDRFASRLRVVPANPTSPLGSPVLSTLGRVLSGKWFPRK